MVKPIRPVPVKVKQYEVLGDVSQDSLSVVSQIVDVTQVLNVTSQEAYELIDSTTEVSDKLKENDRLFAEEVADILVSEGALTTEEAVQLLQLIEYGRSFWTLNVNEGFTLDQVTKNSVKIKQLQSIQDKLVEGGLPLMPVIIDRMQEVVAEDRFVVGVNFMSPEQRLSRMRAGSVLRTLLPVDASIIAKILAEELVKHPDFTIEEMVATVPAIFGRHEHGAPLNEVLNRALADFSTSIAVLQSFHTLLNKLVENYATSDDFKNVYQYCMDAFVSASLYLHIATNRTRDLTVEYRDSVHDNGVELKQRVRDLSARFGELICQLADSSLKHVAGAHSRERVLGALSLEKWIDELLTELDSSHQLKSANTGFLDFTNGKFHETINTIEAEEGYLVAQERITEIQASIDVFVTKYRISSKKLRAHNDGLRLRRELEELEDSGRRVFNAESAHTVAALSLYFSEHPDLPADVAEMQALWLRLQELHKTPISRTPMLAEIDVLVEFYEGLAPKYRQNGILHPVWSLAEFLKSGERELELQPVTPNQTELPEDHRSRYDREFSHVEPIVAFPPGITVRTLREDFDSISRYYRPAPIEWERIESLIVLGRELRDKGFAVAEHRLLNTKWYPLPYYVLEVVGEDTRVAIVESPVYGRATYIVPGNEWREIVAETREDARVLGARKKVHCHGKSIEDHRGMLYADILRILPK